MYECAFSDDGKRLATFHQDERGCGLFVWDFAAGKQLWRQTVVPTSWGQEVVFTPDGNTLITAGRGEDAIIRLRDGLKGTEIRIFPNAGGTYGFE